MRPANKSRAIVRASACTIFTLLLSFLVPGAGDAHPLGNFSINHYSNLRMEGDMIAILYIIDMAEIPTFQEMPEIDLNHDGRISLHERKSYLFRKAAELKDGLVVMVNGRRLSLESLATDLLFPPGAGGLPTMKIGVLYRAPLGTMEPGAVYDLQYRDTNFPVRAGWKEIVAVEGGRTFLGGSSVPASDRSDQLSNYPADIINSPPQDLEAHLRFSVRDGGSVMATKTFPGESSGVDWASPLQASRRALGQESGEATLLQAPVIGAQGPSGGSENGKTGTPGRRRGREAAASSKGPLQGIIGTPQEPSATSKWSRSGAPIVRGASTPRSAFTELITAKDLSLEIILLSLLAAFALGAFHALEPGHGKTVVAAYLIGSRGTARHALLLGGLVTASHTFGVYLLGIITLYLSNYIFPERLYPWLGFASGLTIVGMGLLLFFKYFQRGPGHTHARGTGHHHAGHHHSHEGDELHEYHSHSHGGDHLDSHPEAGRSGGEVTYRELFALGITGGIIPCPAALVVLLSAISIHRIGFGLVLIVAFSIGLAVVLMGIGLLMVYARQFMAAWSGEGRLLQRLPLVSSVVIAILGFAIAFQALIAGGVLKPLL